MLDQTPECDNKLDGCDGGDDRGGVCDDAGDDELLHTYCSWHPMAGPVRPDCVADLELRGQDVTWEWSENAFDKASPGAFFRRTLTVDSDGRLAWAGSVVRTPKEIRRPAPPAAEEGGGRRLRACDLAVSSERTSGFNDEVKLHVRHAGSGSCIEYVGESLAESQSIRGLQTTAVRGDMVRIDFVYDTAENGSCHSCNVSKFVQLGAGGIEWVPC